MRDSVSLIDWLTTRSKRRSRRRVAFSRMRSKTTIVSFIEKPMIVSTAATVVSENSLYVTANAPMTITASWSSATTVPGPYRKSNRNAM